ncbi:MAG: hypothetical protein ACI9B7_000881 [Oleispira sp.]|jgi:hypothetical protein
MIKHSLLAACIAMIFAQQVKAAPLIPIDSRGLAMGNTGVASAKRANAPQYNPALLSTANTADYFAIVLPQVGSLVADEEEIIDRADALTNDEYSGSDNGGSIIDHFNGITDELDIIFTSGVNGDGAGSIQQQIINFKILIDNAPGNGGNNSTRAADITLAAANLDDSAEALNVQTADLEVTTLDLTNELTTISGQALRGNFGMNGAIAMKNTSFAAAVSVSANTHFSGRGFFTDNDKLLLNGYAEGINAYAGETSEYTSATRQLAREAEEYQACLETSGSCSAERTAVEESAANAEQKRIDLQGFQYEKDGRTIISSDPATGIITIDNDLNSNIQIVAVGIAEIGLTLSRQFAIAGKYIAIGIKPKFQKIKTYHYVGSLDDEENIKESDVTNTEQDFSDINFDFGAAFQFGANKQWQVGFVAKNLISKEYEAESNPNSTGDTSKTTVSLDTQFRGGVSHTTDWTVLAFDLDLMENDPVAFEEPTQYASIGAELDLMNTFQLRVGYRANLSDANSGVASVGAGFSPFGVNLDIVALANPNNPQKESGVALDLGFYY